MPRTDVFFKASDGVTLRGWFFTPSSRESTKLPCLILTHGLSCIKEMGLDDLASRFVSELALTCLVYDHRGFGASDTASHAPRQEINTWLQSNDLRDAITYAQTRAEVDKSKIALWGYSLAGAEAVYVAAIDRRVKAVIALGPGMDGNDIVRRQAPPFALNAMQALFEVDRLARAEGKAPITVPVISTEPGGQAVLPSPESRAFFSKWESRQSSWKNELTLRRLAFRPRTAFARREFADD
jgi:dienelactone hydrolase